MTTFKLVAKKFLLWMKKRLQEDFVSVLAAAVLLLFAVVWTWVGIKMLGFTASKETPALTFSEAQVTVAGFLASAIGAGTASVLGIEIKSQSQSDGDRTLATRVTNAVGSSWLLIAGIGVYALVGLFVLLIWFFRSDIAPEMVNAFSLGVLGWFAGAFAAVFRTESQK